MGWFGDTINKVGGAVGGAVGTAFGTSAMVLDPLNLLGGRSFGVKTATDAFKRLGRSQGLKMGDTTTTQVDNSAEVAKEKARLQLVEDIKNKRAMFPGLKQNRISNGGTSLLGSSNSNSLIG